MAMAIGLRDGSMGFERNEALAETQMRFAKRALAQRTLRHVAAHRRTLPYCLLTRGGSAACCDAAHLSVAAPIYYLQWPIDGAHPAEFPAYDYYKNVIYRRCR
jgi:hypothetical protein